MHWNADAVGINENETLETLTTDGFCILQKKHGFRFGTDAVLLTRFTIKFLHRKNGRKALEQVTDFGTGTGILPILLAIETDIPHFHAFEIQEEMSAMARKSVLGNGLGERITVHQGNYLNAAEILGKASQDLVVCNPPYQKSGAAVRNSAQTIAQARHETHADLLETVSAASAILRPSGVLSMVHKPERLAELFEALKKNKLEPKHLQLVQKDAASAPSLILVRACKNGKSGLEILPSLLTEV